MEVGVSMTKWRKMNSAPRDGTPILVGFWDKEKKSQPRWIQFVLSEEFNDEFATRFDAWTVIPKPPHWGKV